MWARNNRSLATSWITCRLLGGLERLLSAQLNAQGCPGLSLTALEGSMRNRNSRQELEDIPQDLAVENNVATAPHDS